MNTITVVDARMGRGKSSAAIRYMNIYKGEKKFLYITPYLGEVDRICEQCNFDQSDGSFMSKSAELKLHLRSGKNIAATHSLFYLMDEEALELVRTQRYSLIIDESIQVIEQLKMTRKDFELIVNQLTEKDENGILHWIDSEYSGRFSDYKAMADTGSLRRLDSALLNVMNPDMLRAFDEIYMLTYLFDGQYQKAYLDYFGFEYRIVGVEQDDHGFFFSSRPDSPPPIDYSRLINLVESPRFNAPGAGRFALSKQWFDARTYDDDKIKDLRNNLKRFFQKIPTGSAETRLWASFKSDRNKLIDSKTGRFNNNFLQVSARATNEYRNRTDIAYMVNRFTNPNIMKFFATKGIIINADNFALSEMLQWIWRSAIRDNKPINLYIPSSRMRKLLKDWMKFQAKEDAMNE